MTELQVFQCEQIREAHKVLSSKQLSILLGCSPSSIKIFLMGKEKEIGDFVFPISVIDRMTKGAEIYPSLPIRKDGSRVYPAALRALSDGKRFYVPTGFCNVKRRS